MQKPFTCLFPVLAILLASASLGVPERAMAQASPRENCYVCDEWDEDPDYAMCKSVEKDGTFGHLACKLSMGGTQCAKSTTPRGGYDCKVVLAMDGRVSPDAGPESWPRTGGTELFRLAQQAAPAVNELRGVARHGCTGAIVQRGYSPARIAELRSDLRRVTI